jgi:hypothetical protein
VNGSAEPELTEDELDVLKYLEETAQIVIREMDRELHRTRTERLMRGFFQARSPNTDVSTQEAFEWIDAHWQCLGCRRFFGPDDSDYRPVCDSCRAVVRSS